MRKKISCFLILMLAVQLVGIRVFAADDAWSINYIGNYKTDRETYYAEVSTSRALNGNRSLYVKYPNAAIEGTYLLAENTLAETVSEGEYTFSICYRGRMPGTSISLVMGSSEILFSSMGTASDVTGESEETGWKKLSAAVAYTGEDIGTLGIKVVGNTAGLYIDDVSLTSGETEYVSSGGFELVKPDGPAVDTVIDKYAPQNIIGNSVENIVKLSWKNPMCDTVTKTSLYEVSDGEDVFISDDFTKAANEPQTWSSETLTEGDVHTYKLIFDYSDRDSIEFIKSVQVYSSADRLNTPLDGWYRLNAQGEGEIGYDYSVSHSGNASLNLRSNWSGIEGGRYIATRQLNLEFAADTEYEISFWIKSNACTRLQVELDWDPDVYTTTGTFYNLVTGTGEDEWQQIKLIRPAQSKAIAGVQFILLFDGMTDVWLDDFSIKPIVGDGEYGDEMLTNCGFESGNSEQVIDKVSNVSTYGYDKTVRLSWDEPDCDRVVIYRCADDVETKIADLNSSVTSVTFNKMESDTTYTFRICPVNALNKMGEGEFAEVKTILPDYIINAPSLKRQVDGKYNLICGINNYAIADGLQVEVLAGVYSGDKLIKLYSNKGTIPAADKSARPKNITVVGIELPTDGESEVRVFFVDSRTQRNALSAMASIRE